MTEELTPSRLRTRNKFIRACADCSSPFPITVLKGSFGPVIRGEPGLSVFRGGWKTSRRSTMRVEVGRNWLYRNRGLFAQIKSTDTWVIMRRKYLKHLEGQEERQLVRKYGKLGAKLHVLEEGTEKMFSESLE